MLAPSRLKAPCPDCRTVARHGRKYVTCARHQRHNRRLLKGPRVSTLLLTTVVEMRGRTEIVDERPRGLLPVPPEVEEGLAQLDQECFRRNGFHMDEAARKRQRDAMTLQHYYEGEMLARRHTPDGVEVLAVGPGEVGSLLRDLSEKDPAAIQTILFGHA